jgi:hypothetical protein
MALAAPAFADTAPTAPAPEQAKAKAKGGRADGVVCTLDTPTGSRFPVKTCTTPEQRGSQRSGVQNAQERMQGGTPVMPN